MTDLEVFEANLLEHAGLGDTSLDEIAVFIEKTDALFGAAALIKAGSQLVEKDQDKFENLLEQGEIERVNALLAMRGIDLEMTTFDEIIRVKRSIIEAGKTYHSVADLEMTIKALLPPEVMAIDIVKANAVMEEIDSMIDDLRLSDELKARYKETIHKSMEQEAEMIITARLSPEVFATIDAHFDSGREEDALALMLEHGVDMGEIHKEAALNMKRKVQHDLEKFKELLD